MILNANSPSGPMPFECVVRPRSEKAIKLIHDAAAVYH